MACIIPDECKLDLWAKVIIAKNTQTDEPILGAFDEYGEPDPESFNVTVDVDETIECIDDFKIVYRQADVVEQFVCTSKVILTIPFTAYFWIKTNRGFLNTPLDFTFTKEIPVSEFVKLDGTPLTSSEFKHNVDQSEAVVCNYEIAYVNILPKSPPDSTFQTVQIIITATVIDKLGKYQDVLVYGYKEDLGCIIDPCD